MPRWRLQRAGSLLLDGEVVAYEAEQTSFSRLQQRLGVREPSPELVALFPVVYCVFDLLEVGSHDRIDRPLLERRARLEKAIRPRRGLQLSEAGAAFSAAVRPGLPVGLGGADRQARRRAVRAGPLERLAEADMHMGAVLRDLGARLRDLETPESPFVDVRPIPRGTHWIRLELVAQIGFAEWRSDSRLRQPRFRGLRDDKRPAEVVRERPR